MVVVVLTSHDHLVGRHLEGCRPDGRRHPAPNRRLTGQDPACTFVEVLSSLLDAVAGRIVDPSWLFDGGDDMHVDRV